MYYFQKHLTFLIDRQANDQKKKYIYACAFQFVSHALLPTPYGTSKFDFISGFVQTFRKAKSHREYTKLDWSTLLYYTEVFRHFKKTSPFKGNFKTLMNVLLYWGKVFKQANTTEKADENYYSKLLRGLREVLWCLLRKESFVCNMAEKIAIWLPFKTYVPLSFLTGIYIYVRIYFLSLSVLWQFKRIVIVIGSEEYDCKEKEWKNKMKTFRKSFDKICILKNVGQDKM